MFCYQCQETAKNSGCTTGGVCGKNSEVAGLQDVLIYVLKGLAFCEEKRQELNITYFEDNSPFIMKALFSTITNVNFDSQRISGLITEALTRKNNLREALMAHLKCSENQHFGVYPDCVAWSGENQVEFLKKAEKIRIDLLAIKNEDIRSLREFLLYGVKGIAAYCDHAEILGQRSSSIYEFIFKALAETVKDSSAEELANFVLKAGKVAVEAMALLDKANTSCYGNPEITKVNIGVRANPGILISGHDLKDLKELLEQTNGTGVDVYTHGEMLPGHYYPEFKKYTHFIGNYGGSWWKQNKEFALFNGPILMTTNCIIPVDDSYRKRMFTTGTVGYPGVKHIPDREQGKAKDFSEIIVLAKECASPQEIETGQIIGGFAHNQVLALSDKIVAAVKSGAIKRFVVMAGCDGRHLSRSYFTEVAEALPQDMVILTAGCAKYRYNKLNLGEINGIPRVLDAGQCNDSYSLVVIALKLKEVFGLEDINKLPISFDIAWYEQKAVTVLLALLHLGIKGIRLGPTFPAFLSPGIINVLVKKFNIKPIAGVKEDVAAMIEGR